jgi:hypothetical protein
MMEHFSGGPDASIENTMWHWFFQATIESEPVDWDCVLMYIFQESGSHCEVVRDTTADMLPLTGGNWANLDQNVANVRTWMHAESYQAFHSHMNACFPTFYNDFTNVMTDAEKQAVDADYIRALVPEASWQ